MLANNSRLFVAVGVINCHVLLEKVRLKSFAIEQNIRNRSEWLCDEFKISSRLRSGLFPQQHKYLSLKRRGTPVLSSPVRTISSFWKRKSETWTGPSILLKSNQLSSCNNTLCSLLANAFTSNHTTTIQWHELGRVAERASRSSLYRLWVKGASSRCILDAIPQTCVCTHTVPSPFSLERRELLERGNMSSVRWSRRTRQPWSFARDNSN